MGDLAGRTLDARTGGRMTRLKLVNLLNDLNLGGVTRGLGVFETPAVAAIVDARTVAIDPDRDWPKCYDADIIVTHFPPSWRRLLFFWALRRRNPRAKLIHVEHSYSREWAALHVPNLRRFAMMLQLGFRCFDKIVAVSHAQAEWLAAVSGVAREDIAIIYPIRETRGLSDVPAVQIDAAQPLVVGAYGRFHEAKNFDTLIRAFNRLDTDRDMRLLIGGYGDEQQHLEQLAAGNAKISFFGKVTDIPDFLGRCHAIIVPSRYECFGNVADEARRAGRAIIVSGAGGLPEQVPGAGICIDCTTEDALLSGLGQIPHLPLEDMGRGGRAATQDAVVRRSQQWAGLLINLVL